MLNNLFFLCLALLFIGFCDANVLKSSSSSLNAIASSSKFDYSASVTPDLYKKVIAGVEAGNKDSTYFYALMKIYGNGIPRDISGGAHYMKKAAGMGHVEAQTAYAVLLMTGDGVDRDVSEATTLLRKSVASNDPESYWLLGALLLEVNGREMSADNLMTFSVFVEAAELLHKAADEFHSTHAEYYLGMMYEYGIGMLQDFSKAIEYYRRSSEKKNSDSMYNLGLMYTYGRGVAQDFIRAFSLFDMAARTSGHKSAAYYMGIFRMYGYACEPDYHLAVNWFELATASDDPEIAEKALNSIKEINSMVALADAANEEVIESYKRMSEKEE